MYERLADRGFHYGPAFRGLTAVYKTKEALYGRAELPVEQRPGGFLVHPAALDAALHTLLLTQDQAAGALLPFALEQVELYAAGAETLWAEVEIEPQEIPEQLSARINLYDAAGVQVARIGRLTARQTSPEQLGAAFPGTQDHLYSLQWQVCPGLGLPERQRVVAVLGSGPRAAGVAETLIATGARVITEMIQGLERRGITVLIKGIQSQHLRVATRVGVIASLRHQNHLFTDLAAAVGHARSHVSRAAAESISPDMPENSPR